VSADSGEKCGDLEPLYGKLLDDGLHLVAASE
jgi:hypothetical protein